MIPLFEHINIFFLLSLVISNNYIFSIFSTYTTLTSNLNIHPSIFIILAFNTHVTKVHTLNLSYLKTIHLFHIIQPFIYTIAIKYINTIILHYLNHTFIYNLTLEYKHHMASMNTITPCSTHHHHNDLMTTTLLSESQTSQGIFHTQTRRQAERTSRSRGHQQWFASQHRLLPSRQRSRELTSANCVANREEEFTSMNSAEPSYASKADIRKIKTDIEKPSLVADEATSDIEEES